MTEMNRRRVPKPVSRERAYGAAFLAFGILSLLAYLVSFFAIWIPLPAGLKDSPPAGTVRPWSFPCWPW